MTFLESNWYQDTLSQKNQTQKVAKIDKDFELYLQVFITF